MKRPKRTALEAIEFALRVVDLINADSELLPLRSRALAIRKTLADHGYVIATLDERAARVVAAGALREYEAGMMQS